MKFLFRLSYISLVLFYILSAPAYSSENTPVTTITSAEGEVVVFDHHAEIASKRIITGKLAERANEYTAKVKIKGREKLCYIPNEISKNEKITLGALVLLEKNSRRIYSTEWDIISVGKSVEAGYESVGGYITSAKSETVTECVKLAEVVREAVQTSEKSFASETKAQVTNEALKQKGISVDALTSTTEQKAQTASTETTVTSTNTISNPASFPVADTIKQSESEQDTTFHESTLEQTGSTSGSSSTPGSPTISTSSLANGTEGISYSQTLTATGGTESYTWSLTSGSLPSGLSISGGGIISGIPSAGSAGAYTFTITVTDTNSNTDSKQFSLTINGSGLAVPTTSLANGTEGVAYSQTLSATGGTTPYTWSLSSGSLPAGLSLSTAGVISGTPTTRGTNTFTVKVTDNNSQTATKELSIKIGYYTTAVDDYVWVANWSDNNVTRINKTDSTTINISVGTNPYGVAVDDTYVWVANSGGDNVTRVTKSTGTVDIPPISVGTNPYGVAVDDTYVWVVNLGSNNVTRITKSTGTVDIPPISVGITPFGIAVDETYVWVANLMDANVTRIKKSNLTTATISVGTGPRGVAVDSTYVWVANLGSNNVTRIKKTDSTTTTISVGTGPFGVAVDDTYAWIGNSGSSNVTRITKSTATVDISPISVGTSPYGVAVDDTYVWIGNSGSSNVPRITKSGFATANITVGTNPFNLGDATGYSYDQFFTGTYVDPAITGRIYDSETGENITGTVASIYPKDSTTALQTSTTNPYSFNVLDGYYYIRVEKEGYTFPSNDKNGITAGDHGENFYASGTSMGIDIPLDQGYPLEITKTANKQNVVNGDIITYDVKIRNNSMWAYSNINIIDEITNGFKYVEESTYTDNTQLSKTNISQTNRKITFKLTNVPGYTVTHLTYQVRVGSGISPGEYKTKAVAWDRQRDWRMSNETSCQINVIADALFTLGTIIGKVFHDLNANGIQDRECTVNGVQCTEAGISGVRIATEYGVVVETDKDGKYHIPAVPPGTHLLKLDMSSLSKPETLNTKFKITTENPYMVKITEGLLAKVNFGIKEETKIEKEESKNITIDTEDKPQTEIPQCNTDNMKSAVAESGSVSAKAENTNITPRKTVVPKRITNNTESVVAESGSNSAKTEQNFASRIKDDLKKFFIVALGEGIVRNINTSGNIKMVEQDDRYDEGVNLEGKLALYLKGKIKGKYLITASIDTDRSPSKRGKAYQMRKLFTNLDPDKYYPVYGDASKIDYSANDTQDELYLLVQWDKSHIKYGAYNTDIPLYNRTLQGAHAIYESVKTTKFGDPYTKINAFYARAYQIAAHDEFIGTGGSLYYLRHTPTIEGSEKIRIELRDELSKQTIATADLEEQKDYEIDYNTGRIILKKPLSSVNYNYKGSIISNDILQGGKAYLIVDYEYESTTSIRKEAYGIKGSQWVGSHIRAGGTYIEEQKETNYYKLMGGDGTIKLNKDTEITAEYDRSEQTQLSGAYSIDGGLSYDTLSNTANDGKSGSSFNISGKTRLFNNTDINLGYTKQDKNFSATNTISTNGTNVYTGSIYTKLKQNLQIGLKHITQIVKDATLAEDITGNNKVHTTTAMIDYLPSKWDIRLEYQHQTVDNPYIDFTYAGYRQLMSNDIIGGRIGYKINDKIHPYIGGQVTVNNFVNNQGYIGVEYQIFKSTYLRVRETAGNLGNSTLLGITTQIDPDTEAYTNIEIGNNAQIGNEDQSEFVKTTTGQKTKIDSTSTLNWEKDYSSWQENILHGDLVGYDKKLTDTLSLGASYERSFIEKEPTAISRDSGSISLTYLDIDHIKAFSKLELRQDRGGTTDTKRQWLTQNNILYELNKDISLLGRANWSVTDDRTEQTTDAEFHEMGIGMSYRPVNFDKLNFLGKYSYITNQMPNSQNDFYQTTEDIKNIYAIEGVYDIIKYLQVIGKFAMRDMSEKVGPRDWTDSQTYLYIGRLNFHITNQWDIAAEYRTLANRQIKDAKSGWLLEIDRELFKYARLGVGYNFTDYDDDLANDDNYDAKGWFVRINGKY